MRVPSRIKALAILVPTLFLADLSPERPLSLGVPDAQALVGRPLTPVSYAGVARRTTRRVVAGTATASAAAASSAAAQQQQAQAQQQQQQAASAPPQAAAPAGAPAVGTIVPALPRGCVSAPKSGVEYYNCGGVFYRPAFQGNNLVYVVQQP